MGFVESIKSFYGRYTDFSTRSSRSEYWWLQLFMFLLMFVIFFLMAVLGMLETNSPSGLSTPVIVVLGLFVVTHVVPSIALTVRRFHDQDKSGWFYLLSLIPYVGGIIVFVFMLLKGTDGPNRFGDDPLGSVSETFS